MAEGGAPVRVGSRGSRLARRQADHVVGRLRASRPGLLVERAFVKTVGDRVLDTALSKIGDKGLFTRELEDALREGRIDLAVHSLKDLPTRLPEGLALGAVLEREDPRDALVCSSGRRLAELPPGARVGTSSLRRAAQLLALRPGLSIRDLRGNVPTRIEKLDRGDCDAVVLALAGLRRLGLEPRIGEVFTPDVLVPAVAQGALAVQVRAGDARMAALLAPLEHRETRLATEAERAFLGRLEGGCQVPVGALGTFERSRLVLSGLVASLDGASLVRGREAGEVTSEDGARRLGVRLAERLLAEGGEEILARVRAVAIAKGPSEPWEGP